MSKGFLTHFSIVLVLHVALLFGGLKLIDEQTSKNNVPKLGSGSITMVISKVQNKVKEFITARPRPVAPEKTMPVVAPTVAQKALPDGGKASGHELGSGETGTAKFDAVTLYKAQLRSEIDKNKYYPPMSKRLGQTGVVVVAFTLLEDGNIINVRIDSPSRYERLNDSALEAVKKVHRFKPIPKEVGESRMDIKVPLKFVTI